MFFNKLIFLSYTGKWACGDCLLDGLTAEELERQQTRNGDNLIPEVPLLAPLEIKRGKKYILKQNYYTYIAFYEQ